MRKFLFGCFVLYLIIAGIRSCSCNSRHNDEVATDTTKVDTISRDTIAGPPPNKTVQQAEMTVYTEENIKMKIPVDNGTLYCLMASWCPYSKKIMTIVNDPQYDSVTKKYKIFFLYDKNEIDNYRTKLNNEAEAEGLTKDQLQQLYQVMRQRKQEGKLLMPEVLSDIPMDAKYYYINYRNFEFQRGGYPSTYNPKTGRFDIKPPEWWYDQSPADSTLIFKMVKYYKKKDKNENQ